MIEQYLSRYAEPEIKLLQPIKERFKNVVAIPCYDEPDFNVDQYLALPEGGLLLINVNRPEGVDATLNLALLKRLKTFLRPVWQHQHVQYGVRGDWGILLVDRTTTPIPSKQGVGLARKILSDITIKLYHEGVLTTPWCFQSDADVTIHPRYLQATKALDPEKDMAAVLPYRHVPTGVEWEEVCKIHQRQLDCYVDSLRWAGSPYAYHCLGSTLIINLIALVKVRGVPKRSAGEDFYLLNKLAKLGGIVSLEDEPLKIAARPSHRTPFGSGVTLQKLKVTPATLYHPRCFVWLKQWLCYINAYYDERQPAKSLVLKSISEYFSFDEFALKALQQCKSKAAWKHAVKVWFDAFKTLKLIHFCRDEFVGVVPM